MISGMPKATWNVPLGDNWRQARVRKDYSVEIAAGFLQITPGALRNIETMQPRATVSARLAERAVRLYGGQRADYVRSADQVPDEPPSKEQDAETNTGPGREGGNTGRGDKDKTGPKRFTGTAA